MFFTFPQVNEYIEKKSIKSFCLGTYFPSELRENYRGYTTENINKLSKERNDLWTKAINDFRKSKKNETHFNFLLDILTKIVKNSTADNPFIIMSVPSSKTLDSSQHLITQLAGALAEATNNIDGTGLLIRKGIVKEKEVNDTRLQQIYETLYITDPSKIEGKNILLLDDVKTRGFTIDACRKYLETKNVNNIFQLILGRTLPDSNYIKEDFSKYTDDTVSGFPINQFISQQLSCEILIDNNKLTVRFLENANLKQKILNENKCFDEIKLKYSKIFIFDLDMTLIDTSKSMFTDGKKFFSFHPTTYHLATLYPQIPTLLTHLKKDNKILGVATNSPTRFSKELLKTKNIIQYFQEENVRGFHNVNQKNISSENRKKENIQDIIKQYPNISNQEVVVIGDSLSVDIKAGNNLGCITIHATWGTKVLSPSNYIKSTYTLKTISDFIDLLKTSKVICTSQVQKEKLCDSKENIPTNQNTITRIRSRSASPMKRKNKEDSDEFELNSSPPKKQKHSPSNSFSLILNRLKAKSPMQNPSSVGPSSSGLEKTNEDTNKKFNQKIKQMKNEIKQLKNTIKEKNVFLEYLVPPAILIQSLFRSHIATKKTNQLKVKREQLIQGSQKILEKLNKDRKFSEMTELSQALDINNMAVAEQIVNRIKI